MRKFLLVVLAILAITSVAQAVTITQSINPVTMTESWSLSVYNNSGSEMDAGDVALWDVSSSTGDNDNYVKSAGAIDTFIVAGVVYPKAIATAETGWIVVKGIAQVDLVTTGNRIPSNEGTLLCDSATDGSAQMCSDESSDENSFGFCVTTPASGSCSAYIFAR